MLRSRDFEILERPESELELDILPPIPQPWFLHHKENAES